VRSFHKERRDDEDDVSSTLAGSPHCCQPVRTRRATSGTLRAMPDSTSRALLVPHASEHQAGGAAMVTSEQVNICGRKVVLVKILQLAVRSSSCCCCQRFCCCCQRFCCCCQRFCCPRRRLVLLCGLAIPALDGGRSGSSGKGREVTCNDQESGSTSSRSELERAASVVKLTHRVAKCPTPIPRPSLAVASHVLFRVSLFGFLLLIGRQELAAVWVVFVQPAPPLFDQPIKRSLATVGKLVRRRGVRLGALVPAG
jgi:hypothetical protein